MPKKASYDFKEIEKIRKEFGNSRDGMNLMRYTIWLEKKILKAENTLSEFKFKLKKCSNRIDKVLQG